MTADTSADSGIPLSAICNFWSGTNIILFLVVIRSHSVVVATRGNNSQSSIGNGSAYQNRIYADFSLESRRDGLDRAALEVAQFQEASLAKRKALAHSTKTFRASASPDVSKAVAALLKEYQLEVDRLTTRHDFDRIVSCPPAGILAQQHHTRIAGTGWMVQGHAAPHARPSRKQRAP